MENVRRVIFNKKIGPELKQVVSDGIKCLILIIIILLVSTNLLFGSTACFDIWEDCPISVSIDDGGLTCFQTGMSLQAVVNGGSSNYTYSWAGPNGFTSSQAAINLLGPGQYLVTVTDALGCADSDNLTISEAFDIQINKVNTNVCQGDSVELLVDYKFGFSYQWGSNVNLSDSNLVMVTPFDSISVYYVTVTSPTGCSSMDSITLTMYDCIGQTCFNGEYEVTATTDWKIFYELDYINDFVRIRAQLSSNFVDNSYGTNKIGWNHHDFDDLVGSDHLILSLFDGLGTKSMEIKLDYLTANTEAASGYASLGVTGGDGDVILGDASDVLDVTTSLDVNLNEYGYDLLVDSPATDDEYTPNPLYPLWIFEVWYEADIKLSAFGNEGFGSVLITSVHASPAKTPSSTIVVTEGPCCELDVEIEGDGLLCLNDDIDLNVNSFSTITRKIFPEIDTYLGEKKHDSNYTKCDKMYIGIKDSKIERPLLKFDLSEIPDGAEILSANYYAIKPEVAGNSSILNDVSLHRVISEWDGEGGKCPGKGKYPVNWDERISNTVWDTPGGDFDNVAAATIPVSVSGTYVWDVKNLVLDWMDGTYENYGFILRQETGDENRKYFWAYDKKDEETYLEIQYIKEEDGSDFIYEWDYLANTQQNITVSPEVSTTFVVTVTEVGGCFGTGSISIEVDSVSEISISGLDTICAGSSVELIANGLDSGLSYDWSTGQNDSAIVVSPLISSEYNLTVTNSNGCSAHGQFTVHVNLDTVTFVGPSEICTGEYSQLHVTSNGIWTSSDTTIASIDSTGMIHGVDEGTATFDFYGTQTSCSISSTSITINPRPEIQLSGPSIVCEDETTQVTSNLSGNWVSSDTTIVTVTDDGLVMAVSEGTANLNFIANTVECPPDSTIDITVNKKPIITNIGSTILCVGEVSSISTSGSGGTWHSSNDSVAIISNEGIVVGVSEGIVTFTYISNFGCESDASAEVTVNPEIDVDIDYLGSLCLEENSQLNAIVIGGSSGVNYNWTGPNGFTSNQQTIDIVSSGLFNVTVTDNTGCSSDQSAFVYEAYEPFILGLDNEICEGEDVTFTVNSSEGSSYLWSANIGSATSQTVTVSPGPPGDSYYVTVTNSQGCSSILSAEIDVRPRPLADITGPDSICLGSTTTLSPTTGGQWLSSNYTVASVTNSGLVTGVGPGVVMFTFQDTLTGCYSSPTLPLLVNDKVDILISGNSQYCIGVPQNLISSETGGSWSSSNITIAEVNDTGIVTPHAIGNVEILYTPDSNTCFAPGIKNITVNEIPIVNVNGPSTICQNDITFLTPSNGGIWTSSNDSVATVSNNGIVFGVSGGNASFSYTSNAGCVQVLDTTIEVVSIPTVGVLGPDSICIGDVTTLTPVSGGIWISSNSLVASVDNSGIVTGHDAGKASFTFIDVFNGCASTELLEVTVSPVPQISSIEDSEICINEITNIGPSIGGYWVVDNATVATIDNFGEITGISPGQASFTYIDGNTGCASSPSSNIIVHGKPLINIVGSTELCIGESSSILPNSGGNWSTSDIAIATITNEGEISAVSKGVVSFLFTDTSTGCKSDSSPTYNVNNPGSPEIIAPDELCIGVSDSLISDMPGTWISGNSAIATISNTGLLTAIAPGSVMMTFEPSGYCWSNADTEVLIHLDPIVNFIGPESICIGNTTLLSPTSGGIWSSSDTTIATVNNFGLVTGIGEGTAIFTFQSNATNCSVTMSNPVEVYDFPNINIMGSDSICIGSNTTLTPGVEGIWTTSNSEVAIISSIGVVTGLNPGTATFKFAAYGSTCFSEASDPVTILPKPIVAIDGDNTICIENTTNLSPISGGNWTSSNTSVATVSEQGVVLGIAGGLVKFTFTSNEGCASSETSPVIVFDKPDITLVGSSEICIGETAQMLPNSGGIWMSGDSSIANISNSGIVTALTSGTVHFTFFDNNSSCSSDQSEPLHVNEKPSIDLSGSSEICIGGITNLSPSTDGIWISINPDIATVQNNGEVFGVSGGETHFIYMDIWTGCFSDASSNVTVATGQEINFVGSTEICIGDTTSLASSSGGAWESTDTTVATITNEGIVVANNPGSVKFRFTDGVTGCKSELSEFLIVNDPPVIFLTGDDEICIGATTQLSSLSSGIWTGLDSLIASVDQSGMVVGLNEGIASFKFRDNVTGCESDDILDILVHPPIDITITGEKMICLGYTTTLSTNADGFWFSSNSEIASISNLGVVTGNAPGVVTFDFVGNDTGCVANSSSDSITIVQCLNPDFNVSFTGLEVSGNISTNDNVPVDAKYSSSSSFLISKPLASQYSLEIDTNGTYTFTGSKKGKYLFGIPLCIFPQTFGCPNSILEINVVEKEKFSFYPVSNLEFATMYSNNGNKQLSGSFNINTLGNDRCLFESGCALNKDLVGIMKMPSNGTVSIDSNGLFMYSPFTGFVGLDTIEYEVCVEGNSETNCNKSRQIITVNDPSALNTVVAVDDFEWGFKETSIFGNVVLNDSDPEFDNIAAISQGTASNPIIISSGEYFLASNGEFAFTPNEDFYGSTDIIYTICDDAIEPNCADATLHILIQDDISLTLRAYIEGALMQNDGAISTLGLPLMRDDLRDCPVTGQNYIPLNDPYSLSADPYINITSKYNILGPGLLAKNRVIVDSDSVFNIIGENAIVDWVHVELRTKNDMTIPFATRSGLIQRDGDIVDLDGVSPLRFNGVSVDSFYVVVKHRSHLGVMSHLVSKGDAVDFTSSEYPVFDFGTSLDSAVDYTNLAQNNNLISGYSALWAGDFDSNGKIKFTNPEDDQNILFVDVLFSSPEFLINYDNGYGYFTGDFNMDGKVKYTNPLDDLNHLFGQVLLYPGNSSFLSNYNLIVEQVPKD